MAAGPRCWVMAAAASCLLTASGCQRQAQLGPQNRRLILSLRTAVAAHRADWLELNAQAIDDRQAGSLSDGESPRSARSSHRPAPAIERCRNRPRQSGQGTRTGRCRTRPAFPPHTAVPKNTDRHAPVKPAGGDRWAAKPQHTADCGGAGAMRSPGGRCRRA